MQKLAEGYFYTVYDIGNNRVKKEARSFLEIVRSIKGKNGTNFILNWMKARKYIKDCVRATETIRNQAKVLPEALIGNPVFVGSVDYEQDKVVLLMDYFDTHSLEENKSIVDKYMAIIKTLLSYAIHDNVYKFKNSYGVNRNGEVIFVDFNEVIFSKEEALKLVQNRQWESEAQFRKFPEGELKKYLRAQFEQTLTTETVNQLWPENRR